MKYLRLLALFATLSGQLTAAGTQRSNILWFVVDDMSAHFSCYGETLIETPSVDKLAAEGTRFTRAYVTAPVCSTCRSALITGMYQTMIGAQHHRSGRGEIKIHLPEGVEPVPATFQRGGYFTCIGSGLSALDFRGLPYGAGKDGKGKKGGANPPGRIGKTDYNFEWEPSIYDGHDWAERGGKPFFMQVQLHGGKLREGSEEARAIFRKRVIDELGSATDPEKVTLPPHYPRDPILLDDWALYLDSVRLTDLHVGRVITRLESEGLMDNTVIVFMSDHGISHARGKQFLNDEGTHIPFVVRGPGIAGGAVRDDLIEHIDMAALSLAAAGIPIPDTMQGRDIFDSGYSPREAVFAARDRCDETVERLRSVRTDQFLYIRNYHPQRPHLQSNAYKDGKAIVQQLRALHKAGTLPLLSEELFFLVPRPVEEFYAYREDPHQIKNLSADPAHLAEVEAHRARLDTWMIETRDPGPESEARYDSDMAEYLKRDNPEVRKNIALMKQWAEEGK